MKTRPGVILVLPLLAIGTFFSCQPNAASLEQRANWIEEVRLAESEFASMAETHGLVEAFVNFAADSAVLARGRRIVKGKEEIREFYESRSYTEAILSWSPEFIEVSALGDMAYTYGPYEFHALDTAGNPISSTGTFHTVWKKQPDGSWKYVYD